MKRKVISQKIKCNKPTSIESALLLLAEVDKELFFEKPIPQEALTGVYQLIINQASQLLSKAVALNAEGIKCPLGINSVHRLDYDHPTHGLIWVSIDRSWYLCSANQVFHPMLFKAELQNLKLIDEHLTHLSKSPSPLASLTQKIVKERWDDLGLGAHPF